jgi:uncharacterized protein (TIGR00288 family)
MNHQKRVMLLIDADNVSADVVEQAVAHVMAQHGAIHVRRAYCTAESALANLQVFKRHSIRPIVNLSTGKNSTDISLAVDAIDLVLAERPDIVVVVSSDSDFAPLVIRLREKGCRVEGIGQQGKTGEDSKPVYDDFIDLAHKGRAGTSVRPAARKRSSVKAVDVELEPTPAPQPAARPARATRPAEAPSRRRATAEQGRRSRAQAQPDEPAEEPAAERSWANEREPAQPAARHAPLPDEVVRILAAVPDLWRGGKMELGVAAEQLRAGNMLARSATSSRLFKKFPAHFALTPERQPNKVQYVGPRVV